MADSSIQKKMNNPVWISIDEACKLLNLKEKTIKEKCRNAEFSYKIEKLNCKSTYFVRFNTSKRA